METAVIKKEVVLGTIGDVKRFSNAAVNHNCVITLVSGRYAVDAKSLMGIFSLDLSKPIGLELEVGDNGIDDRNEFLASVRELIVE